MAANHTDNPTPESAPTTPVPPPRPPRSRGQLLLRILGVFVVLALLVFFLTPVFLSMDWMRREIVGALEKTLDAPVSLEEHSIGWFSGVSLHELRIGNPRTFPKQGDFLRVKEAALDMSLFSLMAGKLVLRAEDLEVRVHQLEDGRTNLHALAGTETTVRIRESRRETETRPAPTPNPKTATEDAEFEQFFRNLHLDLTLTNTLIEVTDEKLGVLESMRNLNASIRKQSGALDIICKLDTELHDPKAPAKPGKLSARADIDVRRSRPWTFHLETTGLDLARYRPLLDWAAANPFEELGGVFTGTADATTQPDGTTTVTGKLVLAQPRIKTLGEKGIDLRGDAFVVEPNAVFRLGRDSNNQLEHMDLKGFRVDLGFFQATGLPEAEAKKLAGGKNALGLHFTTDLAGLRNLGSIVPKDLQNAQGHMNAQLVVIPSDKRVLLQTQEGTTLNGGPLRIDAEGTLDEERHHPAQFTVAWQGGKVGGDAVRLLRYVVPLLAGLDTNTELDFSSDIDTTIQMKGPLLRADKESVLQWLNHWQGKGKLKLTNGGFTPAKQLGELLTFAGERNRLTFKDLDTDFTIKAGAVETGLLKMNRKAQSYGFRGKVFMDGKIDYQIALQDALAGHRDGERIRRYLGNAALEARLGGVLEDPTLAMPSLDKILEGGVEKSIDDAIQKGLDKLLKKKKDRKQ